MMKILLAFLLVSACNAIGDENTYLELDVSGSKSKHLCVPADFGSPFPTLDGVKGNIHVVKGCIHSYVPIPDNSILVLDYRDIAESKTCSVFRDITRISKRDNGIYAKFVNGIVVVHWKTNSTREELYHLQPSGKSWHEIVPTCMVSGSTGDQIFKNLGQNMKGLIHNGASEEVKIDTFDPQTTIETYVDGVEVKDGDLVLDTYSRVAVHVETKGKKNAAFQISFSDFFATSPETWKCTRRKPASNWNNGYIFETDRITEWVNLEHPEDDRKESIRWEYHGLQLSAEENERELYCFGVKWKSSIRKYGYEYIASETRKNFDDALETCRQMKADLVSIHSAMENNLVYSLIPENTADHGNGIWIGLNDEQTENQFAWSDSSIIDFTRWDYGHPLANGADYDCVKLVKNPYPVPVDDVNNRAESTTMGTWRDSDCSHKHHFVCKKYVGGSQSDLETGRDGRCLLFFDHGGNSLSNLGNYPKMLHGTNYSLCEYQNHRSCCSQNYINKYIAPTFEAIVKDIKGKTCQKVLKDFLCFPCKSNQGDYMFLTNEGTQLNVCTDTCIDIFENCKSESIFNHMYDDVFQFCKHLNQIHDDFDHFSVHVKEADEPDCFRVDGTPPKPVKMTPTGTIDSISNVFTIQFNEQVQLAGGTIEIFSINDDEETLYRSVNLLSKIEGYPTVFQRKTVWDFDTLTFFPLDEEIACWEKGTYKIHIPSMSVIDFAGNAFPGTTNGLFQWEFNVKQNDCHKGSKISKSSGGGSGWIVVLVLTCLGGIGFFVYKKKRHDPTYFDNISDSFTSLLSSSSSSSSHLHQSNHGAISLPNQQDQQQEEYVEMNDDQYNPPSADDTEIRV